MSDEIYEVRVTREDGLWLAEVTNRSGIQTFARTYSALRHDVDEAIRLMDDLADDHEVTLKTTFEDVDTEFVAAIEIGDRRKSLERKAAALVHEAARTARVLQEHGFSVRDIGGALNMTAGRVSQILRGEAVVDSGSKKERPTAAAL